MGGQKTGREIRFSNEIQESMFNRVVGCLATMFNQ